MILEDIFDRPWLSRTWKAGVRHIMAAMPTATYGESFMRRFWTSGSSDAALASTVDYHISIVLVLTPIY
eukprot:CAMPEP_0185913714 /NCGR_PEP_ID=MMETSP0924C-20121207/484_1 /TAXON_ID=321610 /ORGANISM="Perkinsus chesapeaki, Strain ATCC PRA-65" /LENGTH=68 /DNA_ID=CAMNT_0028635587 /DNA_START=61 /DNA_END=264 /DNA_ORIENTATION=-